MGEVQYMYVFTDRQIIIAERILVLKPTKRYSLCNLYNLYKASPATT
jgi:hypothetical protein